MWSPPQPLADRRSARIIEIIARPSTRIIRRSENVPAAGNQNECAAEPFLCCGQCVAALAPPGFTKPALKYVYVNVIIGQDLLGPDLFAALAFEKRDFVQHDFYIFALLFEPASIIIEFG